MDGVRHIFVEASSAADFKRQMEGWLDAFYSSATLQYDGAPHFCIGVDLWGGAHARVTLIAQPPGAQ